MARLAAWLRLISRLAGGRARCQVWRWVKPVGEILSEIGVRALGHFRDRCRGFEIGRDVRVTRAGCAWCFRDGAPAVGEVSRQGMAVQGKGLRRLGPAVSAPSGRRPARENKAL